MEPHELHRESSDVCKDEAIGCLWTHLPSKALRAAVMRTTKQTKMTNMKFDHISRQQYVIVFQTRRARQSSTAA